MLIFCKKTIFALPWSLIPRYRSSSWRSTAWRSRESRPDSFLHSQAHDLKLPYRLACRIDCNPILSLEQWGCSRQFAATLPSSSSLDPGLYTSARPGTQRGQEAKSRMDTGGLHPALAGGTGSDQSGIGKLLCHLSV